MVLKTLLGALALALIASIGWHYYGQSEVLRNGSQRDRGARPIVFDNGSVREAVAALASSAPVALHSLRKCQRGTEIVYTDNPCQRGFLERPIRNGSVTVVESLATPKPASASPLPRATLRDVLDESESATLRDKRIERAVGQ